MSISISAKADVSGSPSFDPSAQAFIDEALITDPTQQDAINTLVVGLKNDRLWDKMNAIYPVVGGTSEQHKYNLKDPRDSSDAFTLSFSGGITHSTNGMLPNGVDGYANTYYGFGYNIPESDSLHFSAYFRTSNAGGIREVGCNSIYGNDSENFSDGPSQYLFNNAGSGYFYNGAGGSWISTPDATTLGLYIVNRNQTNTIKVFKNGPLITESMPNNPGMSGLNFYLMGENEYYEDLDVYNTYYGKRQLSFATMGSGLSDADAAHLYGRVQAFQTTLGRQV